MVNTENIIFVPVSGALEQTSLVKFKFSRTPRKNLNIVISE